MGFYQRLGEWRTPSGPPALVTSHQKHLSLSLSESTRAKIDFYSERLKQLAGTNFNKLATESTEDSSTGQSKVSSSSKEEEKESASCAETYEEENVAALKETEESGKPKSALDDGEPEQVCVPDSSNNEPEEEPASDDCPEEQHSSTSDHKMSAETENEPDSEKEMMVEELQQAREEKAEIVKVLDELNEKVKKGEQTKEHWKLEYQLLQMKYDKLRSENGVDLPGDGGNDEELLKRPFAERIEEMVSERLHADSRASAFRLECVSLQRRIR